MLLNNKIIYSPRLNSTELLRSLTINGQDIFNLCILSLNDLLNDANISFGFVVKENVLSNNVIEELVLKSFERDVQLNNPSYQDVKHFLMTTNNIRKYILDSNEFLKLESIVNNHLDNKSLQLLKSFFASYLNNLNSSIDDIIFAHKLIDYSIANNVKVYDEIYYFEEDNISPLEKALLTALSKNVQEIPIISLFDAQKQKTQIRSIMPRYGVRNEVANVIKDITDNQYPLSECQIVLINKALYTNELFKFMNNMNIKMTFETGLPVILSDAYKLYATLTKLEKEYFFDVNGYLNLFASESFNLSALGVTFPTQVAQLLGRMKICLDKSVNDDYLQKFKAVQDKHKEEFDLIMEKIDRVINYNQDEILKQTFHVIEEFSNGIAYIIRNYTVKNINDDQLHNSAIEYIASSIEYAYTDLPKQFRESYLSSLKNKYLCAESFKDDAIHVTSVNSAFSSYRKNIYIIGMNSAFYPGSLTEDFLFNDDLYEELCGIKEITETSLNIRNKYLKSLINSYLDLGLDVSLSYNAQDVSEVRELNPCSVLLDYAEELFSNENELHRLNKEPDELMIRRSNCSYYDDGLTDLSDVSAVAINNNDINEVSTNITQIKGNGKNAKGQKYVDISFSPSNIPKFINCPFRFYLDNIVGADNTITYDPLRPVAGNRFGDLLHFVMQQFINKMPNATLDEVVKYGDTLFDIYVNIDRSIGDNNLEKKPFLNSVENAYKFLKNNFVIQGSQTELSVGYGNDREKAKIGNLYFRGSIDLVTQDKNGNYVVLDYKTGLKIEHEENDIDTCIQGIIYSQLFENIYGKKISKLVFYYTRKNQAVYFDDPCSQATSKELLQRVAQFENALKTQEFGLADPDKIDEACKYCKYGNICKIQK